MPRLTDKEFDLSLGRKITALRICRGMSSNDLAKKIGVAHQQLRKYENGQNSIKASALIIICNALSVDLNEIMGLDSKKYDNIKLRMSLDMIKFFSSIKEKSKQRIVFNLVKSLAN